MPPTPLRPVFLWTTTGLLTLAAGGWGLLSVKPDPTAAPGFATDDIRFGRDVRPILSDRCFKCHGPDLATRAAGLRLDTFDGATATLKSGDRAITPHDPAASEILRRITSTDPSVMMPPPDSGKKPLSDAERVTIERWIKTGATYEPHWAFVAPIRPTPPAGNATNTIDRFIFARLQAAAIQPSPEADRPTLARRVFLDLTGLPPTPEELDAFLADTAPDAYERLVDRLLTQEPYVSRLAERLASPWMDQSRYADTNGIHMDAGRQMWLWRDWGLDAFRTNMPFDRFVKEQLAGDLIPNATLAQKVASGFNRNHVITDEGGAISEEYLVEYAVDRASTVGSVMLGLTVGCARCHDHKYDPVTAEDFYSLYAFFNSIEEPGLYSQEPDPNRAFEPFLVVPSAEQTTRIAALNAEADDIRTALAAPSNDDSAAFDSFLAETAAASGLKWAAANPTAVASTDNVSLSIDTSGSVTASNANPDNSDYTITLRTDSTNLRLIALEALLGDNGKVGRAPNGNAVVTAITATATSVRDPSLSRPVPLSWAWADHSQQNGDFDIVNVLTPGRPGSAGWALQGHERPGPRLALLLAAEPFGFEGGTDLTITLRHQSQFTQHSLARVRLSLASLAEAALPRLPLAMSRWYRVGPFPGDEQNRVYEPVFGPETAQASLDFAARFGNKKLAWTFDPEFRDGVVRSANDGRIAEYFGRLVHAPSPRTLDLSIGSDDAWKVFVRGVEAASRFVERGIDPDRDNASVELPAGTSPFVLKIANTGGAGAAFLKPLPRLADDSLDGDLIASLAPPSARTGELADRMRHAWRMRHVPAYRDRAARLVAIDAEIKALHAAAPRTMVMKELTTPRPTFVLSRGVYDQPDKTRPVSRRTPLALGTLPPNAPADRLGLAEWILAPENPLFARVTINRVWEIAFGTGLVRTTDDFGLQGEWPSHPELLDWLAVEFRESGWNLRHMLRLIVTSGTYRQQSIVRRDTADIDPENRLLAFYPRRRLTAEQIRDLALAASGLLVERLGGPSVKPYQPDGLWQEVAMLQSNTRVYERGNGDDLHRRSLYTYWKRAAPPPSMLTFDAPTRESCTVRRPSTNTPLQALVLWNDEQFVEAARVLAQRTLRSPGTDAERLTTLFRRVTARTPTDAEAALLANALSDFRARYAIAPTDADALLKVGVTPPPPAEGPISPAELAAWTMLASSVLNLHETLTQR